MAQGFLRHLHFKAALHFGPFGCVRNAVPCPSQSLEPGHRTYATGYPTLLGTASPCNVFATKWVETSWSHGVCLLSQDKHEVTSWNPINFLRLCWVGSGSNQKYIHFSLDLNDFESLWCVWNASAPLMESFLSCPITSQPIRPAQTSRPEPPSTSSSFRIRYVWEGLDGCENAPVFSSQDDLGPTQLPTQFDINGSPHSQAEEVQHLAIWISLSPSPSPIFDMYNYIILIHLCLYPLLFIINTVQVSSMVAPAACFTQSRANTQLTGSHRPQPHAMPPAVVSMLRCVKCQC